MSRRERAVRPRGGSYTYACVACQIALHDGVEYAWCPRCGGAVDWIDGRSHVWICTPCDRVVAGAAVAAPCTSCARALTHVSGPVVVDAGRGTSIESALRTMFAIVIGLQTVFAVLDPDGFPYLARVLWALQLVALGYLVVIAVSSRELRALASDRTARVIHGLEHATANVLAERGIPVRGGLTGHGMFALELAHDPRTFEALETTIRLATEDAISRIRFGERRLALHDRCGTSVIVAMLLVALAVFGVGVVGLVLGVPVGLRFAFTVLTAGGAYALARPIGRLAQRGLTVSTEFSSAVVLDVVKEISATGDQVRIAVTLDVIPRARGAAAVAPTLL
ncbi:MAG TPA: DUF6391 domain-containing protein [Kofleriaceae bacterium]|nr:DUF6391 domain-containing protein [Kofleriaceae bacterium]